MADVGSIVYDARIDTSKLVGDANRTEAIIGKTGDASEKTAERGSAAFSKMSKVGIATAATAVIGLSVLITKNLGSAIGRVDTLANSKRTFANMGFDADVSSKAMDDLTKSILGLPTPLDSAVRGMTSLAATYGDISMGQKIFTSLNNAILGFGGTAAEVDNAIQQLSQLPMDGPLDAQTWNSLRNSGLTPVLVAMAKDMGISISQMKEDFGSGKLTVQDFTNELTKMNTEGGGGLKSLQQIAQDSTKGIGTSFDNMNTSIARGIEGLINQIGTSNISAVITGIGTSIESAFSYAGQAISIFSQALSPLITYIQNNQQLWEVLKTSLIAIAAIVGVLIISVGVALVGAFAAIGFAIQLAVSFAQMWIAVIMGIGNALGATIYTVISFGSTVVSTVTMAWGAVTSTFSNVGGWFSARFNSAAAGIRGAFGGLGGFFAGLWSQIVRIFNGAGTAVGNAVSNQFRGIVNSVISGAVNLINGFINTINGALGAINKVPGVSIGKVGTLSVPQLANGGIIMPTAGGTLANIAEAGKPEAVIPLDKLDKMISGNGGGGIHNNIQNINISNEVDAQSWLRRLTEVQDFTSRGITPVRGF